MMIITKKINTIGKIKLPIMLINVKNAKNTNSGFDIINSIFKILNFYLI